MTRNDRSPAYADPDTDRKDMYNMNIGDKIRKFRKAANMTQTELAGNKITRNMLSCIENGSALPSVQTLVYIAERLSVPPEFLISESDDLTPFLKLEHLADIKREFSCGHYRECIRLYNKHFRKHGNSDKDDELAYIMTYSLFYTGRAEVMNGEMNSASLHFAEALEFAEKTVYDTFSVKMRIELYRPVAENIQQAVFSMPKDKYQRDITELCDEEFFKYMTDDQDFEYSNRYYANHIAAKKLMKTYDYNGALGLMKSIEDNKSYPDINMVLLFRVYSDMEICCREITDFENAYRYSTKRLSLLESFRS